VSSGVCSTKGSAAAESPSTRQSVNDETYRRYRRWPGRDAGDVGELTQPGLPLPV